jgi:hypothetical protein
MPAFAGDDLDGAELAAMAAHVRDCGPCAALAEGYRESLELARAASAPDVEDAFYGMLRAAVLAEIASEHRRPRWRPLAIAAALAGLAAATLLAALVLSTRPAARHEPIVTSPKAPPAIVEEATPVPTAPEVVRNDAPRKRIAPRRRPPVPRTPRQAPADTAEMMRIEYQTANPNIRVIWFVPRESNAPARHEKSGA